MCWKQYKKLPQTLDTKVSDDKVEVIKICEIDKYGKLYGFFHSYFEYELNKEYKTEMNIKHEVVNLPLSDESYNYYEGNNGFHSYSKEKCKLVVTKEATYGDIDGVQYISISMLSPHNTEISGYSSHYSSQINRVAIVKGYIPKGSTYLENENGEIISEGIVLTEILNLEICLGNQKD